MSIQPRWFFDQELALGLPGGTVIGQSYYARPSPRSPLRLRVDFHPTIRHREYGGLRVRILHEDKGTIDDLVLSFADHRTFQRRDQAAAATRASAGTACSPTTTPPRADPAGQEATGLR